MKDEHWVVRRVVGKAVRLAVWLVGKTVESWVVATAVRMVGWKADQRAAEKVA